MCMCLMNKQSRQDGFLTVSKGRIVASKTRSDGGWYEEERGRIGGREGGICILLQEAHAPFEWVVNHSLLHFAMTVNGRE